MPAMTLDSNDHAASDGKSCVLVIDDQPAKVVIDDCGHAPQFEHPDLTAKLTTEFIAALP